MPSLGTPEQKGNDRITVINNGKNREERAT